MSKLRKIVNTSLVALVLTASAYQTNMVIKEYGETKAREELQTEREAFEQRIRERFGDEALECPTLTSRIYWSSSSPLFEPSGKYTEAGLPILEYTGPRGK